MKMQKEKIEILQTAVEYLERLYPAVIAATNDLRTGDITPAYKTLGSISEGLEWLFNVITLTQDVHKIDAIALKNIMSEMIEALENEDSGLIADLLEYEIGDKLNEWYDTLNILLNEVEKEH